MTAPPTGTARRRALLLALLGAALLWVSSRLHWVSYTVLDGLRPPYGATIVGADWAAGLAPLALAIGAALLVALVARGRAQPALALAIGLLAALALIEPLRTVVGGIDADRVTRLAELPARAEASEIVGNPVAALVAVAGAALGLAAALLLARAPRPAARSSNPYETPAVRKENARTGLAAGPISAGEASGIPLSDRLLWDALDAGEDPTTDDPEPRRP
ncbi:TIGR02234 family membrane protein [Hoyosella sp. G463]|uniref:TIGR02234 family membrane protein n=1 Tax=Lolliginicoccus lacisalsi TaxID=2742202 RepID=A0A927JBM4_9ACTN|nr:TIGR02234 family membrane protein [Lolliginicoccus lacisalsi]MBD8506318.1 TIGR02234 family membrane protein [Lolliginicoccus lacisalsi]